VEAASSAALAGWPRCTHAKLERMREKEKILGEC
jgi:hypothetical protein